jgi:hypothetical protein
LYLSSADNTGISTTSLYQVFSLVNLEDSNHTRELTEASRRDSEATKQLSYLTMVFLPSIFIAVSPNLTH